jgi:hypothetical protein
VQWRKRKIMGKYLYTLYHLDPIEEETKWNGKMSNVQDNWQTHKQPI